METLFKENNVYNHPNKYKFHHRQFEELKLWKGVVDMSPRDYGMLVKAGWDWTGSVYLNISIRRYFFLTLCAMTIGVLLV